MARIEFAAHGEHRVPDLFELHAMERKASEQAVVGIAPGCWTDCRLIRRATDCC